MSETHPSFPARRLNARIDSSLKHRFPPGVRAVLGRLLLLDQLDDVYAEVLNRDGQRPFVDRVLDALNVNWQAPAADLARIPATGRALVVANHPFGAIEGLVLASTLRQVRPDVKIMANWLLGYVQELHDLMIFVDPFAGPGSARDNARPLKESIRWLKDDHLLVVFPAGEVARIDLARRQITDPNWSETVARVIRITESPALPVFFEGYNSALFQLLGLVHPRLRTVLLPHEFLNKRDKRVAMRIGNLISFRTLEECADDAQMTAYLRQRTYMLGCRNADRAAAAPPKLLAVVPPEDPSVLAAEVDALPADQALVAGAEFKVFYARAAQIPALLNEIGRLREITFRAAGEGSGRERDIDEFDATYLHLFLWNAAKSELVGAYRLGQVDQIVPRFGKEGLYTSTLFEIKPRLFERLGPALELGRSFVRPEYQRAVAPLFLLWKGIGQYVAAHPRYRVLFGPVSISNEYTAASRQVMVEVLKAHYYMDDLAPMVSAITPFQAKGIGRWDLEPANMIRNVDELSAVISDLESDTRNIPVLLRQYLKLGGRLLGFNIDPAFSNTLDGLIMVDLTRTDRRMLERYLGPSGAASFLASHAECEPAICA